MMGVVLVVCLMVAVGSGCSDVAAAAVVVIAVC